MSQKRGPGRPPKKKTDAAKLKFSEAKQIEILEEKFKNRFENSDKQFVEHCQRPMSDPPNLPPHGKRPISNNSANKNNRRKPPNPKRLKAYTEPQPPPNQEPGPPTSNILQPSAKFQIHPPG